MHTLPHCVPEIPLEHRCSSHNPHLFLTTHKHGQGISVWAAVQKSCLGHPERKNKHRKARHPSSDKKQTFLWGCKEQKLAGRASVGEHEYRTISQLINTIKFPFGALQVLVSRAGVTKAHLFDQQISTEGPCVPRQRLRCLGVNQWGEDKDWGLPCRGHSA